MWAYKAYCQVDSSQLHHVGDFGHFPEVPRRLLSPEWLLLQERHRRESLRTTRKGENKRPQWVSQGADHETDDFGAFRGHSESRFHYHDDPWCLVIVTHPLPDLRGRGIGLEVAEQDQDEVSELLFRGHTHCISRVANSPLFPSDALSSDLEPSIGREFLRNLFVPRVSLFQQFDTAMPTCEIVKKLFYTVPFVATLTAPA